MDDIKILLGKRIKELRKINNITQQQLAEAIGIDQRSLSAIECGINFPTKHFMKFANFFNISVQELFAFDHIKFTDDEMRLYICNALKNISSHDLMLLYKLTKFIYP